MRPRAGRASMPDEVMVEAFAPGRELTVTVMGDRALAVTDIITAGLVRLRREIHASAARATCCRPTCRPRSPQACLDSALQGACGAGLPRGQPDRFPLGRGARGSAGLILLETNTQPGMTPTSLAPEQAAVPGHLASPSCAAGWWRTPRAIAEPRPAAPQDLPRARDPAPSRLRYRWQRLWLTPAFRAGVRLGLPVLLRRCWRRRSIWPRPSAAGGAGGRCAGGAGGFREPAGVPGLADVDHRGAAGSGRRGQGAGWGSRLPMSSWRLDLDAARARPRRWMRSSRAELRVVGQRAGGADHASASRRWCGAMRQGLALIDATGPSGGRAGRAGRPAGPAAGDRAGRRQGRGRGAGRSFSAARPFGGAGPRACPRRATGAGTWC